MNAYSLAIVLLEPYAVRGSMFRYSNLMCFYQFMVGTAPKALHTYAILPILADTYTALIVCWSKAAIKMTLKPELRKLTIIISSLVAQCAYCSSVVCGLGDVFNGAVVVTSPMDLSAKNLAPAERKAIRMVIAATKLPARVTPKMRKDAEASFGSLGLQLLAQDLSLSGFSNTLNTILATELDESFSRNAEIGFNGTGFSPGPHKFNAKILESSKYVPDYHTKNPFKNMMARVHVIGQLQRASTVHDTFLIPIPTTQNETNKWLAKVFGFIPRYLAGILNIGVKRTYCTFIAKVILVPDPAPKQIAETTDGQFQSDLLFRERLLLAYVYFMGTHNNLLALHFAYVAIKIHGIDSSDLHNAFQTARSYKYSPEGRARPENRLELFSILTFYSARRFHKRVWRLAPELLSLTQNPATVLSFATLVSTFAMLHRYSAMMDDGA
ncbi:UNVERIFIED_CONTAM: hypothetical protein HDU68_008455, partial [Siphonaria sp. JEL0065]